MNWVQVLRWRHWKLLSPSLWLCSQEGFPGVVAMSTQSLQDSLLSADAWPSLNQSLWFGLLHPVWALDCVISPTWPRGHRGWWWWGGAAILPKNAVLGEEGWISRLLHHLRVSLPSPLTTVLVHVELRTRRTWCRVCGSGPLPGEIPYAFLPAASAPLTTDTEVITHSKTSTSVGIFLLHGILENLCCLIQ